MPACLVVVVSLRDLEAVSSRGHNEVRDHAASSCDHGSGWREGLCLCDLSQARASPAGWTGPSAPWGQRGWVEEGLLPGPPLTAGSGTTLRVREKWKTEVKPCVCVW